jgi:hypothetical protein
MAVLPRPTFRLDLKFVARHADGSTKIFRMSYPGEFGGRSVVYALAAAAEAACEEISRISKRPPYDLLSHIGADYHLINATFVRVDVEDEDDDAIAGRDDPGRRAGPR